MPAARESLVWWHSDQAVLPSAATVPWTATGAGFTLSTEPTGVRVHDTNAAAVATYSQKWFSTDSARTPARYGDRASFQIQITGTSKTAGWASGASPIGFWIDDGARALGVSVGDALSFIDPVIGTIIATATAPFPWLTTQTLLLVKAASDRWILSVNGVELLNIAYSEAPASIGSPAHFGFGSMDSVGLSDAIYEAAEVGINRAVPPQWKIDRAITGMPVPLQSRWTSVARAALRATLGLLEDPLTHIRGALESLTAVRIDQYRFNLTGKVLPAKEIPAWTNLTAGHMSVVRQRLRLTHDGLTITGGRALFPAGTFPQDVEYTARAEFTIRSYTLDAQSRIGPHVLIFNGDKQITAQMVKPTVTGEGAWALTNGALSGAITYLGTKWHVDPLQHHRVEVQVLGRAWVLLLIDDVIVERKPYSIFPASATTPRVQIGCQGQGAPVGPTCTVDIENAFGVRRFSDLTRRPAFLQNAVERLIFVGGCERNDELDTWMRHHQQVEGFRGATQAILIEMRRLSCNESTTIVATSTPGDWYLERTYPEVTPIWLEVNANLLDIYVEFGFGSINFTPQQLADLAAQYLVPTSVLELQYYLCLATLMTGNSIVPAPGTTRFAVVNSAEFAIGDTVTVRNAANTILEDHVISAIPSAVLIETDETSHAPFVAGDTLRKILATT